MIDFWVSTGSTYSYLSIMRLHAVAGESGVAFRWRPFSVRAIMIEQKNIPFIGMPVKLAYMWRDIGRRARARGLEPRLPAPIRSRNSISPIGSQSSAKARAGAPTTFAPRIGIGSIPPTNRVRSPVFPTRCARSDRIPPASSKRPRARISPSVIDSRPKEAKSLGVFGSPTFVVDGEVFWGDDRVDDAICWRKHGRA